MSRARGRPEGGIGSWFPPHERDVCRSGRAYGDTYVTQGDRERVSGHGENTGTRSRFKRDRDGWTDGQ